ncbi:four helix bundle protein [Allomuricauda sp. SCSIO 65647]|uniref:four helix bundle protein n=1 Tax=Allomuricauda sp. SCSIO 65647 TaxID=2908843 RepID=UPI001F37A1C5|nr:four helix bundle protein [Muricauda sp. SCSIO 65647]UJH68274.1 four helix bundle protein [Muricauda sp. SCSIO 65647]
MRNFRDLEVWQDARNLVKEIYHLTKQLPESEKYGHTSQINRCAISIPTNIAEGCSKYSQKDFIRFLQISLGSLFELETHILLYTDLQLVDTKKATALIEKIQLLQKRIASLIKYNKS